MIKPATIRNFIIVFIVLAEVMAMASYGPFTTSPQHVLKLERSYQLYWGPLFRELVFSSPLWRVLMLSFLLGLLNLKWWYGIFPPATFIVVDSLLEVIIPPPDPYLSGFSVEWLGVFLFVTIFGLVGVFLCKMGKTFA